MYLILSFCRVLYKVSERRILFNNLSAVQVTCTCTWSLLFAVNSASCEEDEQYTAFLSVFMKYCVPPHQNLLSFELFWKCTK